LLTFKLNKLQKGDGMSRSLSRTTVISRGRLSGVVRGERIGGRNGALAEAAGDREGVDEAIYYRARLILGESLRRPDSLRRTGR
jgi:hypothetical protein